MDATQLARGGPFDPAKPLMVAVPPAGSQSTNATVDLSRGTGAARRPAGYNRPVSNPLRCFFRAPRRLWVTHVAAVRIRFGFRRRTRRRRMRPSGTGKAEGRLHHEQPRRVLDLRRARLR